MSEQQGEPASGSRRASPPSPPPSESAPPPAAPAAAAPADVGADDVPTPGGRSLLRRKGFWWGVAAGVALAGDVMLTSLISGWRADASDLQSQADGLGQRIAVANGLGQGQQNQIDILTSQSDGATTAADSLRGSADEQETSAHAFRDVALDYQACYDSRGEAIANAWAGASTSDALAAADAACARADEASAALAAGG